MLTPSAVRMSAEPAFDDSARLPCLATGTPQAATTSAAAVETLKVPDASPPVPQVSIASAGCRDLDHARAQRLGAAGQLVHGLAAHPERHQEAADLGGRRIARHHDLERLARLREAQHLAGGDQPDQRLHPIRARRSRGDLGRHRGEEIAQQAMAVLGRDALGMELHAVDRQGRGGRGP